MSHPIIFRSYGAGAIILSSLVYKHFVPTGLRRAFQQGRNNYMKTLQLRMLMLLLVLCIAPILIRAQHKSGDVTLEPYIFEAQNKEKVEAEL